MSKNFIPIDWDIANQLLAAGSPGSEVAAHLGMHPDTFYRRVEQEYGVTYTAYAAEKRSNGDALLRLHQYQKALGLTKKGDNTLLIWLGKQRLGQKETPQENVVNAEVLKYYTEVMMQLALLQSQDSDLKISETSINTEAKSAFVAGE